MRLDAVRRLWERLRERGPAVLDESGSFTESEREAGRMVLPLLQDLQSAREALTEVERRTQALEVALDHLPVAAVVVDEAGRYLTGNEAARRLFGGSAVPESVLRAARAGREGEEPAVAKLPSGGLLRVVPGEAKAASAGAARVLFLVPADGDFELSTDHLQARYGLTAAQGRVVSLVALGLTNKEIAARLSVSSETVHKHLAAIFQRVGLSTRAGLVALAFSDRFGIELPSSV
jgi:DNA-binding CsgD family transcriptional regulator